MPKCDFSRAAFQLYRNRILAWVLSCKFAACFQNDFSSEHLWLAASEHCHFLATLLDHLENN